MFILEIGQLVCFHWFSCFSKMVGDIHTVIYICISVLSRKRVSCFYQTKSHKDKCYPKLLCRRNRLITEVSVQTLEWNFVGCCIMTVVCNCSFSQHLPSWSIIVPCGKLESSHPEYYLYLFENAFFGVKDSLCLVLHSSSLEPLRTRIVAVHSSLRKTLLKRWHHLI